MINTPWIFMGTFQNRDFDLLIKNGQTRILNDVLGFDTAPIDKTEGCLEKALKTLIENGFVKREDLFISDKVDAAYDTYHSLVIHFRSVK